MDLIVVKKLKQIFLCYKAEINIIFSNKNKNKNRLRDNISSFYEIRFLKKHYVKRSKGVNKLFLHNTIYNIHRKIMITNVITSLIGDFLLYFQFSSITSKLKEGDCRSHTIKYEGLKLGTIDFRIYSVNFMVWALIKEINVWRSK